MKGLIPKQIECPNCGEKITTIQVKEEYPLYFNNQKWVWGCGVSPESVTLTYYCSECGEELPRTDELEVIVESAE